MKRSVPTSRMFDKRELEGGIEWIVARQLAPIENELERLRANVEALKAAREPW